MPKSTVRKKKIYTPPSDLVAATAASKRPSAPWVGGLAVGLILFGLVWLVVFYLTGGDYPVASWGYWNLGIGFASLVGSLIVLSRWK